MIKPLPLSDNQWGHVLSLKGLWGGPTGPIGATMQNEVAIWGLSGWGSRRQDFSGQEARSESFSSKNVSLYENKMDISGSRCETQ